MEGSISENISWRKHFSWALKAIKNRDVGQSKQRPGERNLKKRSRTLIGVWLECRTSQGK